MLVLFLCGSDVLTNVFFHLVPPRSSSGGEDLCSIKAFSRSFRYLLLSSRNHSVLIPSVFFLVWILVSSFLKCPLRCNHLAQHQCLHHLLLVWPKLRLLQVFDVKPLHLVCFCCSDHVFCVELLSCSLSTVLSFIHFSIFSVSRENRSISTNSTR